VSLEGVRASRYGVKSRLTSLILRTLEESKLCSNPGPFSRSAFITRKIELSPETLSTDANLTSKRLYREEWKQKACFRTRPFAERLVTDLATKAACDRTFMKGLDEASEQAVYEDRTNS